MAAPLHVATSTSQNSATCTIPADVQVGDQLVLVAVAGNVTNQLFGADGWGVRHRSSSRSGTGLEITRLVVTKTAVSGDAGSTVTITNATPDAIAISAFRRAAPLVSGDFQTDLDNVIAAVGYTDAQGGLAADTRGAVHLIHPVILGPNIGSNYAGSRPFASMPYTEAADLAVGNGGAMGVGYATVAPAATPGPKRTTYAPFGNPDNGTIDATTGHWASSLMLRGVAPNNPTSLAPAGATGVNTVTLAAVVSDPHGLNVKALFEYSTDNATWTAVTGSTVASGGTSTAVVTLTPNTTYFLRARTQEVESNLTSGYVATQTFITNRPPLAPTLGAPANATTLDRTSLQRFSWTFNDADPAQTQSKYDLQYRLVGAAAWTTVSGATPNAFHDFAAGTFSAGDYEWQVRTYDQAGVAGPFSGSGFFTAATPPPGPTITSPINGSVVGEGTTDLVWSYPTQSGYRARKVADAAGSPDTAIIYYDSGLISDTTTRSVPLTFPVNGRFEHLQILIQDSATGLLSVYSSVRVEVSFTPPATPTLTVLASNPDAAIAVTPAQPAPAGAQPTVSKVDILRRETAVGGGGIRIAKDRSPTGVFFDYTPASGVDYQYAVVAYGTNGSTAQSAWTVGTTTTDQVTVYPGGY